MAQAVQVHPSDNVAVALAPLVAGATVVVAGGEVFLADDIPAGHKFALAPIASGEDAVRYGFPFGHATADIGTGAHVHSHNVATTLGLESGHAFAGAPVPRDRVGAERTFLGYPRPDGSVGTRNEIWIIPSVGCVGRTAERLATLAGRALPPGIDGIHAFPHPFGCSQLGDDLDGTTRLIASLACNPNAGGVLLLGLGCESNQLSGVMELIPEERRERIRIVGAQASSDEIADGLAAITVLATLAAAEREEVPLSALRLGVKCGGSDGLSGLTANPLIGRIATAVGDAGGAVVLTEIPEMFGAEQILLDRCVDQSTHDALEAMVDGFKRYFVDHGEPVSENPSPGNIKGGITTLEEKSLGAVQKGGVVPVTQILPYAARAAQQPGLAIVEGPGNDAVSTSALAAAGATLTLFSTGRGTPLGSPVPTLKIASNSPLAANKPGWIDFDAGQVLEAGMDPVAGALLDLVVATASGQAARNEINDERGIAIWKRGVTL
ncbi:UxaA family hydrolase [Sphingomonas montanisoli]|uniref:Altronate dehydratase n=1 Tax=Sphingomonas montanisoli TaxID=2606412 RepID=A0A5D9C694_9SPHN|nr:altronate dehydratase family protein [Sphingomonas montanisoli]TZG27324.1 altronate dehydratase [Sphingomonas montanisoli]